MPTACLDYLKASHHVWERGQDTFGDGRSTALVRLVAIGHLEQRPYDHTSLAAATKLSRTQVMRRCLRLEQAGWVINKREATRVSVIPTEALLAYWQEQATSTSPVISRWVKVALMLGIVTLVTAAPTPEGLAVEMIAATAGAVEEVRKVRRP